MEDEEDGEFQVVMEAVGTEGPFQKRFNMLYNMLLMLLCAMASINFILAISTPAHWCHVPGRNETNLTIQEWKMLTIPREEPGEEFSKCSMYNTTDSQPNHDQTVSCAHGWEYDNTWYRSTISSEQNWVCANEIFVPNTFTFARMGEIVGTLIIGQLGDQIGRRPVMFLGIALLVLGRLLTIVTVDQYVIFLVANIIVGLQNGVVFQPPLIIGMEISSARLRAQIALLQCVGWTSGLCIAPLIAWAAGGDWRIFMLITTLPCASVFLVYRTFPESPRWLATRGRWRQCMVVLRQIARANGTSLPDNTMQVLQRLKKREEKVYGMASLFANRQLFKNAVLMCICLTLVGLFNFTIVLGVSNMSGNPFLNMFLQAVVELPGFLAGMFLCDKYGRRWTQAGAYFTSAVFQFICVPLVLHQHLLWLQISLVLVVKFSVTVASYCAYLQCMEIYPTCLRQTGTSVGLLVATGLNSVGPYIVYLGTAVDMRYPYAIQGCLCLVGIVCSLFLPETLNQRLPETLEDSAHFGKEQKFWNFPWRDYQPTATK